MRLAIIHILLLPFLLSAQLKVEYGNKTNYGVPINYGVKLNYGVLIGEKR